MTLNEAMHQRHTVRKYKDTPLSEELAEKLRLRMEEHNRRYRLAMELVTGSGDVFGPLLRLVLAKGVQNYFVLAGEDCPELGERLGYCSADLMLYAQTLGLNTWWVGGTYRKSAARKRTEGKCVLGIVAVGYGAVQGRSHKSKRPTEVSSYAGGAPAWFRSGVEAALLAPTALNKQAFFIRGRGSRVSAVCDNGVFSGVDLGLVKYHFEMGAGAGNFEWE